MALASLHDHFRPIDDVPAASARPSIAIKMLHYCAGSFRQEADSCIAANNIRLGAATL
jgi:hypothetical protein